MKREQLENKNGEKDRGWEGLRVGRNKRAEE